MNNWHRRIWTLDPISKRSPISKLFAKGKSGQFWFEPNVERNTLQFRVTFEKGAMTSNWEGMTLTPMGSEPRKPNAPSNGKTERLEGTIRIDRTVQPVTVFIVKGKGKSRERLSIIFGRSDTAPSGTGIATAQN